MSPQIKAISYAFFKTVGDIDQKLAVPHALLLMVTMMSFCLTHHVYPVLVK